MFTETQIKQQISLIKWGLDVVEETVSGPRQTEALGFVQDLQDTLKMMLDTNRESYRQQGLCL